MTASARLLAVALIVTISGCSTEPVEAPALTEGAWSVDSEASRLSYVSIKAGEIAEINRFETLTGSVNPDGEAVIDIDLASVSTGVDIRDERMRDIFFEVADNPTARVTAQIDPAQFEALDVGESTGKTLSGTLNLRGIEAPFETEITVTRTAPDRVLAVSDAPIIVEASQYGLVERLGQLQDLANLPSITPAVPVTFSLTFER